MEKINEGKTKVIWALPNDEVLIESKDVITAGDGKRRDLMVGKAALATETTVNCFSLLTEAGIPNHFISQESETTFRAKRVNMIPIELVARRLALGSFLERNPHIETSTRFPTLCVEFFEKNDSLHDPYLRAVFERQKLQKFNAHKPCKEGFLSEQPFSTAPQLEIARWGEMRALTKSCFKVLEEGWARQNATLVDMKTEAGVTARGELVIGDVLDCDSWHLWKDGDPSQMMDKQPYRDGQPMSVVREAYEWVTENSAGLALAA